MLSPSVRDISSLAEPLETLLRLVTEHENYYQQHEVRLCEVEQRLARVGKGGPPSSHVDSVNRKLNDMQSTLQHLDKKLRSDAKKHQVRSCMYHVFRDHSFPACGLSTLCSAVVSYPHAWRTATAWPFSSRHTHDVTVGSFSMRAVPS
jgi:hypothetical protein